MSVAIKTENLVKIYKMKGKTLAKPVEALTDLNLEVKEGDIFGFIGPNGAGKTTTIKILVGLISPSTGSAEIFGHPAGSVKAKKKLGYLSEVAHYYPFMEVGKLLDFFCSFFEIKPADRAKKIDKVLEMVGLSEKKYAKMNQLSKGMHQRFGIAQAIIADPPLLILDELTSGLDPIAQKEVKDIVLQLKSEGKTIFFSSHQMTEVENICDKIGIIHKGVMRKCATLDEFLEEESEGMSRMVFQSESEDALKYLKEKDVDYEKVRTHTYSIIVPQDKTSALLDGLREKGATISEMNLHRFSLEDAFFKLIKEDAKK